MKKTLSLFCGLAIVFAMTVFTGCTKNDTTPVATPLVLADNNYGFLVQPAVSSTSGASFSGTYDASTRVFSFTIAYRLTSRPAITIAIGGIGFTTTRVVTAYVTPTNAPATGTTSGSVTLDGDQARELLDGNLYYALATAAYPTGEIRGQIKVKY